MNYTLNQLQIFLTIVKTKSVTKASEELHLTQPAVSIQLKKLQDQFDIPLTEIIGRKIYITEFGYEIAEAAQNIVNELNAISFKSMAYKGLLSGKLKVSSVSTGKYVMPFFLADFIRTNKGVELVMDVTNKNKVITNIEKNEVDFALVSIIPENLQVQKLDLIENKLYLIAKKTDKKKNSNFNFETTPFIFREKGSGTRQTMEQYLEKNQIKVSKKMELTSNEAVKQAVLAGLGCSVMPLIGIKNELENKELEIIPVKGLPITTMWSLIWPKDKKHAPIASAYLEFIKRNKQKIIQNNFNLFIDF